MYIVYIFRAGGEGGHTGRGREGADHLRGSLPGAPAPTAPLPGYWRYNKLSRRTNGDVVFKHMNMYQVGDRKGWWERGGLIKRLLPCPIPFLNLAYVQMFYGDI